MNKIVLSLVGVLLASCADTNVDTRKQSKNFTNDQFKNSTAVKTHSFWEIVWSGLTSDIVPAEWPESVETTADKYPLARVSDGYVRVTYVNHATFLIQAGGVNILTDPIFSERTSPLSFIGPKRIHKPGIAFDDLPKIDAIIISHDHYDHLDLESVAQLIERDKPLVYMGLGVGQRFNQTENIVEMDWGDSAHINKDATLWFLEVQHFSGRTLTDRNSTLWGGFLLEIAGKKIYFGGDSGYANHYKDAYKQFGAIDIALLPIGAYSPRELFKPVHLDPYEAVQAHIDLQSKLSIGMHYGTFQLSAEPRDEPIALLGDAKHKANIANDKFITINVGEPFTYSDKEIIDDNISTVSL
ncbi:MBL fold metallo-hydrolase [Shewanella frigidimarina]|uniref:MBL fold metallo-hydrolase n=1 Tax=Shewanella frigidimarina TaxID=56812 RepID=UPI003D7A5A20